MPLSPEQLSKLESWNLYRVTLERAKAMESQLRDELVKELFNAEVEQGSESIEIENGWQLKATKKLDYKLSNKEGECLAVVAILDQTLAAQLVRWTPELSQSTYKELDAATQALFNGCLTIKPAKPILELVPPKAKE